MSTSLVRAALCSFITESEDLSERSKSASDSVRVFLDELSGENPQPLPEFDQLATDLVTTIENCVCTAISSEQTCRAKSVLREHLWRAFHQLRIKELVDVWKRFYSVTKRGKFDPLIEQHVNQKLFEDMLRTHLQVPQAEASNGSTIQLSEAEENIIRYAAGYVSMSLLKKYEKGSSDKAVQYIECLSRMAVNGEESSFLAYTLEWSRTVNRGGLFEINDETFHLFQAIELDMQKRLLSTLSSFSNKSDDRRQFIIDAAAADTDVQFVWARLSSDIKEEEHAIHLLKEIIGLWLTIRGFSIASAWTEQYKRATNTNSQKSKGLRKNLQKNSQASTSNDN